MIIKNISSNLETLQDEGKLNGKGENDSSPTKERTTDGYTGSSLTHQSSNESVTAIDDKSISNDLGSVILLSDVGFTFLRFYRK